MGLSPATAKVAGERRDLVDRSGFTLHDGQDGVPSHDATARWRAEQETVVEEVTALLALYDEINLGKADIA
jgi:hypothetical protein